MSWSFLFLGIFFEILGTTSMKLSAGFSKWVPSILLFLFYGLSLTFVTLSLKKIEVSIAYAVWSGLGTAIITAVSFFYFKEPVTLAKIFFILMIIGGVIGLNFSSGSEHQYASKVSKIQQSNN
ncbi:DMT family transporter [Heyndrickxia acidiproducens]|uniref:DMT family transporter n=1 Tax=Heyndrickxia acidiproducens TaxID=1121084 RepID=UPI00037ECB0B|nr:multidrug efflux SMR transporter [Heyndrickxia acidiproducens]